MYNRILRLTVVLGYAISLLLLGVNLHAQALTGTIMGRVVDQSGAIMPGVRVVSTNDDTGYNVATTTDSIGYYSLSNLPYGVYTVEASIRGFATVKRNPITLSGSEQLAIDFTLAPGTVQQTVEVKSAAEHIQTQEAAVKAQIYLDQVNNLPLNSRSPFELGLLAPSTQVSRQQAGDALQYTINGQNTNGFYLMFDGLEAGIGGNGQYWAGNNFNLSMTSLDAIQEYDIGTGNYSAEAKGSAGYVNIVSKTGTNKLHGDVYDFFRNGAMDAKPYFATKSGLKQNDFGGTIGGPIKHDKVFYLLSYEGQQIHFPFAAVANVPTMAFDATVDPRLAPFLAATPYPTQAIAGNPNVGTYSTTKLVLISQNMVTGRMDFNSSTKDRVFAQYTFNDGQLSGAALQGVNGQSVFNNYIYNAPERHQDFVIGWTRTFTPSILNDLKLGINRYLQGRQIGPSNSGDWYLPGPMVPGLYIAGGGNVKKLGNTQPQMTDKATWIRGRSTLSFGGSDVFLESGANQESFINMIFPTLAAFAADQPSSLTSTFGTGLTEPPEHLHWNQVGLFAQEDFRATHSLTLNFGLRYDDFGVFVGKGAENTVNGPFDAFTAPGQALYQANHDFAPRFGFAWKPVTGKPLVVRGGFGEYFGMHASGQTGDRFISDVSKPFTITTADVPNLSYPFGPAVFANASGTPGRYVLKPKTPDTYTLQWNFTGEYQFGASTVFTLGYVGNHSEHIPGVYLVNNYDPLLGHRPNTNYGAVNWMANEDSMKYSALQASLRRRLSNSVAYDVYFAWQHTTGFEVGALEGSSAVGSSSGIDQVQTYKNRDLSRGNLPSDVPINFSTDLVYQLPRLAGSSAFTRTVLGTWSTSGIFKASSGLPMNILTGGDTGDQTFTQRPNRVPGVPLTLAGISPASGFINPAAFTVPTAVDPATGLILGNMANNEVRMPTTFTCDWMLGKRLLNSEKMNLDFRAEFFNILNHPVFSFPTLTLNSSVFGRSTATAIDNREIQLMLKLSF